MKRVLFDALALTGYSGQRGIGQMIGNLLAGLEEIRDEWRGTFEITALERLSLFGAPTLTQDLAGVAARATARPPVGNAGLMHARRFRVPSLCKNFDLLHQPEALGTPWQDVIPRVVTCHDLIPLRMPEEYLRWPTERVFARREAQWRYPRAARVVCISERTRKDLLALTDTDPARVEVVPLGILSARWSPTDTTNDSARLARLGVGARPFMIYAGAADRRKNAEGMIATLGRLRAAQRDIELVWAGALDERTLRKVTQLARRAGVESSLKLLGFVDRDDLAALFRQAAAHLFLSRLEGFGLTVAEALTAGCPVVVARDSGADEVAGDAAILVDATDAEGAAQAIMRLQDDPALRSDLSARGIARMATCRASTMARGYVAAWERTL